ncbi:mitochondrial export protein Som1 [Paraphoma chrysanthemicola]|uniref:Mitochondrial export protein Som1 n=1 Tax=Paraphoma chrysanthemicola TaxID=798071 RepID=A0A8K0R063_9PLEO|nr:mitochondrial export protein Som1 [Paraphoma chrysanthemicola]
MSPPVATHHLSELESQVNVLPNGKARKPPVKLLDCPLKELVQYKCNVVVPEKKGEQPTVVCEPVVRLLRMCEGGPNVETTAWERWKAREEVKANSVR